VDVVAGNGQMICPICPGKIFTVFAPMEVRVTDASGNPIAGKTVTWVVTSITGGSIPSFDTQTTTDSNGYSVSRLFQSPQGGTAQSPFLQSVINASADAASVNFTETVALTNPVFGNQQLIYSQLTAPQGTPLKGPSGGTGTDPIKVHIDGGGVPVPNVSLRILNDDPLTQPSATCATAPGADPGSVLTDANGDAICYPVFGPVAGNGPVQALVGGLVPSEYVGITPPPIPAPVAFDQYPGIQLQVSAVSPGLITIVSGNNQTVNPGQASAPLVVKVTDASGAVPIANTAVNWTLTGAGATLTSNSTTTDSNGQARTTANFSASAVGQISVKAALTGANSGIATTFTLNTNVQIASLTKVSGDSQSIQANQNFPAPLIVQVNGSNGQPVVGQPVSFTITGGGTLSATSVPTDASGRAQVSVKAGATPGAIGVTAAVGNISQSFALTVIPPGPALSTGSFYNAGGGARLTALSPCSLVTITSAGLAPNVQGLVLNTNPFGPWATTLAGDTVTVNNVVSPIYSVGNVGGVEQLTFQVPCETATASSVPVTVNVGGGSATVNLPVQAATPGIFQTVMSDGTARAVAFRPDGTFVSLQNPARRGETIRVYVTGMGPAVPAVTTGALPFAGGDAMILGQVIVGVNNSGARLISARVSPNLIGVSEIAFQVPADAPTGNDVVLSVAVNAPSDGQTRFSNGSKLPIVQ